MRHASLRQCHPFIGLDLAHLLASQARVHGDHTCLTWSPFEGPDQTWTFADFDRAAAQVAGGMQRRGVNPGDRVLICLHNCPEFLLSWFACARLGAIAVLANPNAAGEELAYFADHAGAKAAVTQPVLAATIAGYCPVPQAGPIARRPSAACSWNPTRHRYYRPTQCVP